MQAQRSRFDLSWYLFLRCATVPARFRFRPFGRACLPLIPDAPDCICSPGHLWFWVVWASCLGAAAPISIHAPRVGRDFTYTEAADGKPEFQSTRPVWGATPEAGTYSNLIKFQSTRPVWGATAFADSQKVQYIISIHAPRVGRDKRQEENHERLTDFNPRAPCGARHRHIVKFTPRIIFQSTRPVWGATHSLQSQAKLRQFQSTRPVWGATSSSFHLACSPSPFQSTRPVWGATVRPAVRPAQRSSISIHAPRVGRDPTRPATAVSIRYFNPRAPCGARHGGCCTNRMV